MLPPPRFPLSSEHVIIIKISCGLKCRSVTADLHSTFSPSLLVSQMPQHQLVLSLSLAIISLLLNTHSQQIEQIHFARLGSHRHKPRRSRTKVHAKNRGTDFQREFRLRIYIRRSTSTLTSILVERASQVPHANSTIGASRNHPII